MTINFSTRLFYDRSTSAMQTLAGRADTLQTQIATGKKLLQPSDDSVGYQRLRGLAKANADGTVDAANISLAQSVLQQADTALGDITEQLQRASELVLQARNGTISATGREATATELEGILASIVSLANAKDARGAPLFGGASGTAAVTSNADGSLTFVDGEPGSIPIGDGQDVQPSSNASRFLSGAAGDIGSILTATIEALRAGDTPPDGALDNLSGIADQVTATQASIGARAARVDLIAAQIKTAADDRETVRTAIEDVDPTAAITELQKTMTILQATQASFSKLSSLSLFDYLR